MFKRVFYEFRPFYKKLFTVFFLRIRKLLENLKITRNYVEKITSTEYKLEKISYINFCFENIPS